MKDTVRNSVVGASQAESDACTEEEDKARLAATKEVIDFVFVAIDAALGNIRVEFAPSSAVTLGPLLADIEAVR